MGSTGWAQVITLMVPVLHTHRNMRQRCFLQEVQRQLVCHVSPSPLQRAGVPPPARQGPGQGSPTKHMSPMWGGVTQQGELIGA